MDDEHQRIRKRKQPCPSRIIQDPFALTEALERDVSEECCNVNLRSFDNHICGQCNGEFYTMPAFLVHKRYCTNEWPVLISKKEQSTVDADPVRESSSTTEDMALNLCVNNSSVESTTSDQNMTQEECPVFAPSLSPDGVVQIQSALRSLQGQQMVQLQLIQQIYSQLLTTGSAVPTSIVTTDQPDPGSNQQADRECTVSPRLSVGCSLVSPSNSLIDSSPDQHCDRTKSADHPSAFNALKSQVINSLKEMEHSVAEQIREQRKADTYLDKLYRHRCHFCGKVMSSESSLQIHIRSHTGERPYACTICDSRFSTKGNLKVHMDVHRNDELIDPFTDRSSRSTKSANQSQKSAHHDHSMSKRKFRIRSASVTYSSSSKAILRNFRDDFAISNDCAMGKYSDISDVQDANSKSDDVSSNSGQNTAITIDQPIMPIDLRVSNCESKKVSPLTSQPIVAASYFSPTQFSNAPLFNGQPPKSGQIPSTFFMNALENGNSDQGASISPSNGADLDEDWESMMEITTTDEAEKIKSLVGDRETKVTDPNQCLICHRILSCKSALQMHYRTHTGERPFKCKICSRAFTTKGNLKTHMGVHRTKPPFRLFHQCPICHKKFNNGIVLQQHIRLHTGHQPDIPLEHIQANEIKDVRPPQPTSAHSTVSILSPMPTPTVVTESVIKRPSSNLVSPADTPKPNYERTPSTSSASTIAQIPVTSGQQQSPAEKIRITPTMDPKFPTFSPFTNPPLTAAAFANWLTRFGPNPFPLIPFSTSPTSMATSNGQTRDTVATANRTVPIPTSLNLPTTNPFTPIILPSPSQPSIFGRPNTTCNICFKTFACNSALEIHYRSHTKERPFKCTVCNRGFSTKGNMKQHLLTHKIRDSNALEMASSQSSNSGHSMTKSESSSTTNSPLEKRHSISPPTVCATPPRSEPSKSEIRIENALQVKSETGVDSEEQEKNEKTNGPTPLESIQSMWARTESLASASSSPIAKRPPVLSKHQCQVCYKHFSSSSALAIHMRTHTGERPFVCPACGRSFTTKGNLKVHMSTHSWQHAQSRRGRRIFDSQPSGGSIDHPSPFMINDRSSTATSLEECSNASSLNSDPESSPNGRDDLNSKDCPIPAKKVKQTSPTENNIAQSSVNGAFSPTSTVRTSNYSSNSSSTTTTPIFHTSLVKSMQNGSSFSNASVFPTSMTSPTSNLSFLNAFQPPFIQSAPGGMANFGLLPNFNLQDSNANGGNPMQTMLWMWRNVCSVCRHVCSSVTELEDHLKLHLSNSNSTTPTVSSNENGANATGSVIHT